MLYRNIMLRLFKSLSLQEICMKLILYMIYMKIHKTILHYPMKDDNQDWQEYNPDQDLEAPTDDLLDFINRQDYSDDQLDQVLQT